MCVFVFVCVFVCVFVFVCSSLSHSLSLSLSFSFSFYLSLYVCPRDFVRVFVSVSLLRLRVYDCPSVSWQRQTLAGATKREGQSSSRITPLQGSTWGFRAWPCRRGRNPQESAKNPDEPTYSLTRAFQLVPVIVVYDN